MTKNLNLPEHGVGPLVKTQSTPSVRNVDQLQPAITGSIEESWEAGTHQTSTGGEKQIRKYNL